MKEARRRVALLVAFWIAAAACLIAGWDLRESWQTRSWALLANASWLVLAAIYLSIHPFLTGLASTRAAYAWSVVHGLSCLALDGRLEVAGDIDALIEAVLTFAAR